MILYKQIGINMMGIIEDYFAERAPVIKEADDIDVDVPNNLIS